MLEVVKALVEPDLLHPKSNTAHADRVNGTLDLLDRSTPPTPCTYEIIVVAVKP